MKRAGTPRDGSRGLLIRRCQPGHLCGVSTRGLVCCLGIGWAACDPSTPPSRRRSETSQRCRSLAVRGPSRPAAASTPSFVRGSPSPPRRRHPAAANPGPRPARNVELVSGQSAVTPATPTPYAGRAVTAHSASLASLRRHPGVACFDLQHLSDHTRGGRSSPRSTFRRHQAGSAPGPSPVPSSAPPSRARFDCRHPPVATPGRWPRNPDFQLVPRLVATRCGTDCTPVPRAGLPHCNACCRPAPLPAIN